MPVDTKPDPTPDQPFQYSLQTLLLIMIGLCVSFGLIKWNPFVGVLAISAGLWAIAIWISQRNQSSMDRPVAVIVIIAIAVNGFLFVPCFVSGLVDVGTQDCRVRGLWLLSVALGALVNICALMVAFKAHVRLLSTIAFVANGYLLCLALWFWLEDGNAVFPTITLFYAIPWNVIALLLGVACWREANRVDA